MTEHVKPDTATLEQAKRMLDKWQPEEEEIALAELKETIERMPHEILGVPVSVRSKYEQFHAAMLRRHHLMYRVKELYDLETLAGPIRPGFLNRPVPVVQPPEPGSDCRGEPNAPDLLRETVEKNYGITLVGTYWKEDWVWDMMYVFNLIDGRTGAFRNAFHDMKFLFNDNLDPGAWAWVKSKKEIHWAYNEICKGDRGFFRELIVHELGHVLEKRTGTMLSVATAGGGLWLPNRKAVSEMQWKGYSSNEETETIADHFMFWMYQVFIDTPLGRAAKVYMDGGWIVYDSGVPNKNRDNPLAYPFSLTHEQLQSPVIRMFVEEYVEEIEEAYIIRSPGVRYWMANAKA